MNENRYIPVSVSNTVQIPGIKKYTNKNNIRNKTEISNIICDCFFKLSFTFLELKNNNNKNNIRNKTEIRKEINKLYARLCSNSK